MLFFRHSNGHEHPGSIGKTFVPGNRGEFRGHDGVLKELMEGPSCVKRDYVSAK